ncbi:MAG: hypothetical protein PVF25_19300, partial [Desulfobacterales bacterium]
VKLENEPFFMLQPANGIIPLHEELRRAMGLTFEMKVKVFKRRDVEKEHVYIRLNRLQNG